MVEVSFGKVKKSGKNKDDRGKAIEDTFAVESQKYKMTLGVLDSYIRRNKLYPRSIDEGKVKEEEMNGIPKLQKKFNFRSWFFQNMSLSEVMKGGELFLEQFKHMMNEGQGDHANHFAMHYLGWMLPEDSKIDLISRIEETEKKEMDAMISRLKGINSALATQMIERWMLDKHCPKYKQDAGVMFMLGKYGALCAKGPLYKYK